MASKTDFARRRRILGRARYELLLGVLLTFGVVVVTTLVSSASIETWVTVAVAVGWVAAVAFAILAREERLARGEEVEAIERTTRKQIEDLEQIGRAEERDEAINLSNRALKLATSSLRSITDELREYRGRATSGVTSSGDFARLKKRLLRHVCKDIRYLFEGDTRGIDKTAWPHNFFKVAIFEPEPAPPEAALYLRRTFYDYPEAVEPSAETELVEIRRHPRAAHVLAFQTQGTQVIQDIKAEDEKQAQVKRWVNLRENQKADYESMICIPIVSGVRDQPGRQCLGVMVVDTDREGYFTERRDFQSFLGNLLNPFRTMLTFILDLEAHLPYVQERSESGTRGA